MRATRPAPSARTASAPRPRAEEPTSRRHPAPAAPNPLWHSLALRPVVQAKRPGASGPDPREEEADRIAEGGAGPVRLRADSPEHGVSVPAGFGGGLGEGRALDEGTRAEMEPRVGADLGAVRVHTGAAADASARSVGALAYASGQHVVLGGGAAPGSTAGRRLLAHELAHVAQQRGAAGGGFVQRKARAVRFQDEPTLDAVSEGKKVLRKGDAGDPVVRVTVALADLGFYPAKDTGTKYGDKLTTAVTTFQASRKVTGARTGEVDQPTFTELDGLFDDHYKVERDVLGKQKAGSLDAGTQTLDADEKKLVAGAISTEPKVDPVTGNLPEFKDPLPGKGAYEARLRTLVDAIVVEQWERYGKGRAVQHADKKNLFTAPELDPVAGEAQKAVHSVFGEYLKGRAKKPDPLKMDTNFFDAWAQKEKEQKAGGSAWDDKQAAWRVEKIITGDKRVATLDAEHGVVQSRDPEKKIIVTVKKDLVAKYHDKLVETHLGWPGNADPDKGVFYVQLFRSASQQGNALKMWGFFKTFIHEYIHTLEHPDHRTYRGGMGEQKGGKTLREGVTDYFTKVAWSSITITDDLRKRVEGTFHDPANPVSIPDLHTYHESENAERLAATVGLRNVAAAFFLGRLDLIGK